MYHLSLESDRLCNTLISSLLSTLWGSSHTAPLFSKVEAAPTCSQICISPPFHWGSRKLLKEAFRVTEKRPQPNLPDSQTLVHCLYHYVSSADHLCNPPSCPWVRRTDWTERPPALLHCLRITLRRDRERTCTHMCMLVGSVPNRNSCKSTCSPV